MINNVVELFDYINLILFVISIIVAIAVIIFLFFDLKKTKNSKVLINNRRRNK